MIRSLRARLLLAIMGVVVAAIVAVALFSRAAAQREFDQFLVRYPPASERPWRSIAAAYARTGSWKVVQKELERVGSAQRLRALVVDDQSRVVAAFPRDLAEFAVTTTPDGTVRLARSRDGRSESLVLRGGGEPILARNGTRAGTIFFIGSERSRAMQRSFVGPFNRWLLIGLTVALLVALVVTATLFRRLLAPLEQLTAAVRALGEGRRDVRIDARGDDEIAELSRAFNTMTAALVTNEAARRNMVSDIAHELRTPLTNIRCQIEAAQDGVVQPDARLLASLEEETLHLARLVDDLQQLSLADAGQLRLDLANVPVEALIDRALDGLDLQDTVLRWKVDSGLTVRADPGRAVQVLRNLIVNGVRHARTTLEVAAHPAGEHEVAIVISDDGEGVPPDQLERIFERFHRADASRSRATGGAGLGLTIARELVRLHGGTIAARNREEGGAEFRFTLPRVFTSSS